MQAILPRPVWASRNALLSWAFISIEHGIAAQMFGHMCNPLHIALLPFGAQYGPWLALIVAGHVLLCVQLSARGPRQRTPLFSSRLAPARWALMWGVSFNGTVDNTSPSLACVPPRAAGLLSAQTIADAMDGAANAPAIVYPQHTTGIGAQAWPDTGKLFCCAPERIATGPCPGYLFSDKSMLCCYHHQSMWLVRKT